MNTQTPSKRVKAIYDQVPRKVTPEASRLIVRVEIPLSCEDQGKIEPPPLEAFDLPFVYMGKSVNCSLIPRPDASQRAVALMRALPVPKLALRRRVNLARENYDSLPTILPTLPTETAEEFTITSDNANREPYFTPGPAPKRLRLSPPPALNKRFDSCELLIPQNAPPRLLLPSI
jgi:hypothetical protein